MMVRTIVLLSLVLATTAAGCEVSVRRAPEKIVVRADGAVGSLSGPAPPVLRVSVTQGDAPLVGADVRFIALDEEGEELGNVGFTKTDAQGVAQVPLGGRDPIVQEALLAAVRYEADVDLPDATASGRGGAQLRVTP